MSPSNVTREQALAALARDTFDVLIVGGGITGTGIARDAVLRGLKVALVEKGDLGGGTSSKSTKLVHGGLRYLEQGQLGLVFESVNERKRLMRLARHLVRPLPFLVTSYADDRRWLSTLDLGLWLYDALCFFGSYRNHRTYLRTATLALEPGLRLERLRGGVLFYDCLTDDARLTLENALDAHQEGAAILTYTRATNLLRDGSGRVTGICAQDVETGLGLEARAKVVINATGPWCDELRALAGDPPVLKPTKGVHLVVGAERLPIRHAMMMSSPTDGRVVFAIPWGLSRTVVGTTDTFFDASPDQVSSTREDVGYLLATANQYFPRARLTEDDVISTWAGLRPLLRPAAGGTKASQVSREHTLYERPGMISIAGGKLTTYRRMAAEVVDRTLSQLGTFVKCRTKDRPLPGGAGLERSDACLDALAQELTSAGLPSAESRHLAETYGSRATQLVARFRADTKQADRLDPELPYVWAQVDEAVEREFARTLEDVLGRRTQLLLRGRDQGLGVAARVAERMSALLGWSVARTAEELAKYRALVESNRAYRKP